MPLLCYCYHQVLVNNDQREKWKEVEKDMARSIRRLIAVAAIALAGFAAAAPAHTHIAGGTIAGPGPTASVLIAGGTISGPGPA